MVTSDVVPTALKHSPTIEVVICTIKHADTFQQAPLDQLYTSLSELFDLTKSDADMSYPYNDAVLEARELFRQAIVDNADKRFRFRVEVIYVSRGDPQHLGREISARAGAIEDMVRQRMRETDAVSVDFMGASQSLDRARRRPDYSLRLPFIETALSRGRSNYVVLCRLRVDAANLQYVREGHGYPVVVIGSATYYPKAFSRQLRDHCDLIFVDSRHFVPSYTPPPEQLEGLSLDTFADDVEVVRQHLGVEQIAVLGHSVHAQIALAYARKYPDRTSQLVLIAGVPYAFAEFSDEAERFFQAEASPERKEILARNTENLEALLAAGPPNRTFAIAYQARGGLYWADPRYDAASLLEGLGNGPAFNRLFGLVPSQSEVRRSLQELKAPTLLVLGQLDFAIPYTT